MQYTWYRGMYTNLSKRGQNDFGETKAKAPLNYMYSDQSQQT